MSGHEWPSSTGQQQPEPGPPWESVAGPVGPRLRSPARPVAWVWLAALLVFAGALAFMVVGTAAPPPDPPQPAANGPRSLWVGVLLVPVAAVLAAAATLVSLVRPGLRWSGLSGVLGFALMVWAMSMDLVADSRTLGQVLVLMAVACFLAATVLAFRARPLPGRGPRRR